jgi:hypothetical protein
VARSHQRHQRNHHKHYQYLDDFTERVLEAAGDGDGAALLGLQFGKLLGRLGRGRIGARAGLADNREPAPEHTQ